VVQGGFDRSHALTTDQSRLDAISFIIIKDEPGLVFWTDLKHRESLE
jgi:hypothetical protein